MLNDGAIVGAETTFVGDGALCTWDCPIGFILFEIANRIMAVCLITFIPLGA